LSLLLSFSGHGKRRRQIVFKLHYKGKEENNNCFIYWVKAEALSGLLVKTILFTTLYKKGERAQYHVDIFFSDVCFIE